MRTAGIIGGIAPESTIDYYRSILAVYRERTNDGSAPSLIINSIDMHKMLGMIGANKMAEVTDYLVAETERLARAGADFGILASNTPHIVFDRIQQRSPIPLISIVQAACDAARKLGLRRLGLFGTRFTMQGTFYPQVMARAGIAIALPSAEEQSFIHEKYMGELVKGIFLPATRDRLFEIVNTMRQRENMDGLILGGTELPLILRGVDAGIPLLDTTQLHVAAIVENILE